MVSLTSGCIDAMLRNDPISYAAVKVSKLAKEGQSLRFIEIFDGSQAYKYACIHPRYNDWMVQYGITPGCVIRITKYALNTMQSSSGPKTVILISEFDVPNSKVQPFKSSTMPSVNQRETEPAGDRRPFAQLPSNSPEVSKPATESLRPAAEGLKTPPKARSTFGNMASPSTPGGSAFGRIYPITSLNPYQNKWSIKGRVTQKSAIRTWNNQRGEGKLFSFTLTDQSGEIKVTAFKNEVDKFFELIQLNKVYRLTKASVRSANKQFNSTSHDYEMCLSSDTVIEECSSSDAEAAELPLNTFSFVPIGQLDAHAVNEFVDIVGIVHEVGELTTIMSKSTQKELKKRELGVVDSSKSLIRLSLWGEEAVLFSDTSHPAIVVKGAKISDFGGRSLTLTGNSTLLLSCSTVPEALKLKGWYEVEGIRTQFETFKSEMASSGGGSDAFKYLEDVTTLGGSGMAEDKPVWFQTKAWISFIKKDTCLYQSCVEDKCNKKVINLNNGLFRCEKCAKESARFNWRLLLQVNLIDSTDNLYVTFFQEAAEFILQRTAEDVGTMKELQREDEFDAVFMKATFSPFLVKCRSKMETYNDEHRLKTVAVEVKPLDFIDLNARLLKSIQKMSAELPNS